MFHNFTRRAISALALATAAATLAACSSSSGSTENAQAQSENTDKRVLAIGTDTAFAPYDFEENGEFVGVEIDIMNTLADSLNVKLEINKLGFDSLIPSLDAGRIDVNLVGGWNDGPKRREAMNLVAYFNIHSALLVQKGNTLDSLSQLCGKTISALAGSTYIADIEKESKACEVRGEMPIDILQLNQDNGVLAVKTGRAIARVDEGGLMGYIATQEPDLQMNPLVDYDPFPAAIGVAKNQPDLAREIADALEAMRASGKLAEIFTKWGLPTDWIRDQVTVNGS